MTSKPSGSYNAFSSKSMPSGSAFTGSFGSQLARENMQMSAMGASSHSSRGGRTIMQATATATERELDIMKFTESKP